MSSKLREALGEIYNEISLHDEIHPLLKKEIDTMSMCSKIKNIIKAALAEPIRNCDVGTAEEQETMFTEFCDAHKYVGDEGALVCSRDCPCYKGLDCGIQWSQMPYESEVKK